MRVVFIVCLMNLALPLASCVAAQPGEPVDVVPFGQLKTWDAQGKDYGVIWEEARDIFRVVVQFADSAAVPEPKTVRLEYWQSSWPHQRIPRDRPSGAGSSGWLNVGDWFQGRWMKADTNLDVDGAAYTFTFNPVNSKEFPKLRDFAAPYRSTMKLRLMADERLPEIAAFQAHTDSVWDRLEFEIEWGGTARDSRQIWDGHLEVLNGVAEEIEPITSASKVKVASGHKWASRVHGRMDGIRGSILYAKPAGYNSFDETVVTVRAARETFSFAASDLIKHGHIFLPDFGVIVRKKGDDMTYTEAERTWKENRLKNIYARVADVPEQTLPGAWKDVPQKEPHYIPLGFDGGRQYFGVEADGSVFCRYNWLARIRGKDTKRCLYEGNSIRYAFALSDAKLIERHTVDGCLPMIVAQWQRDGVRYQQTAFVVPFDGVPEEGKSIYADDTLVLMIRFEMERAGEQAAEAGLDMEVITRAAESLEADDGLIFVRGTKPRRLRMLVTSPDAAASYRLQQQGKKVVYRADLAADKPTRTVDVAIPYITLTDENEWSKLRGDKRFLPRAHLAPAAQHRPRSGDQRPLRRASGDILLRRVQQ